MRSSADGISSDELREHQANERTFLAWIRTGIALMGFGALVARIGVVVRQLQQTVHPQGASESVAFGIGLVALSILVFVSSTVRYAHVRRSIAARDRKSPGRGLPFTLGFFSAAIAIAVAILLAFALRA